MPSGAITKYETKILAQKVNNSSAVLLKQKTRWHRNTFLSSSFSYKSEEAIDFFAYICINKPKRALHVCLRKQKNQPNKTTNKQAIPNKPCWISKLFLRFFNSSNPLCSNMRSGLLLHFAHHSRCAASGTFLPWRQVRDWFKSCLEMNKNLETWMAFKLPQTNCLLSSYSNFYKGKLEIFYKRTPWDVDILK